MNLKNTKIEIRKYWINEKKKVIKYILSDDWGVPEKWEWRVWEAV